MIQSKRLARRFVRFAEIDSVSREEADLAAEIKSTLEALGGAVAMDDAGSRINGNCGNLVARFKGTVDVEPLLLSGHMDTVEPGRGVKVVFEDGVFRSDGTTILGSDDKSALAIILEVLEVLKENDLPRPPIEVVFTVAEEVGLLGAKAFDLSMIDAKIGYILDSTDLDGIVTRAPSANRFTIRVHGKDAHAGAYPENGINAIQVASKAMADLTLGRIDAETTCNIGRIQGGKATNIVPDLAVIEGEARSHDESKLAGVTQEIISAFERTASAWKHRQGDLPRVEVDLETDFPATHVPDDHPVVRLAIAAGERIGTPIETRTIGGGADANVFFGKGVVTGVLGTGMTDVHTVRESIRLADMEKTARLVLEIIALHVSGGVR